MRVLGDGKISVQYGEEFEKLELIKIIINHHPGLSWIEIKDRFHVFSADDELHERAEDVRAELRRMKTMIGLQQESELI